MATTTIVAPAGTVTFLFTDIEGSTELWEGRERAMSEALIVHDTILHGVIEAHGGYVFSKSGDGIAAAFSQADAAVTAAVVAQRELRSAGWPEGMLVRVRMGLHTGEAHERAGDYLGPPVNRAARVMAAANGGQVTVSGVTRALVATPGIEFIDLGMHALRGVPDPVRLFGLTTSDLAWVDAPLRTTHPAGAHLPRPVSEVIGRSSEVMRLVRELPRRHLVTLIGPGGVGKTRLAVEVAWLSIDTYPDGAWLVELATVADPSNIASAIASTTGVRPQEGMTLEDSLIDSLRDARALIVLDSCEHVLAATRALVSRLTTTCPRVTILATSRAPIAAQGEVVWPVPSLDPELEGVMLFCERAFEADTSFSPSDDDRATLLRLCERLDGIPLAIELAAARVRSFPPAELLERVDDRFRLLRRGPAGGADRHETLRATVAWSYQLLGDADQRLFERLSVFPGSFDLSAVEAICQDDQYDALDLVDMVTDLVDKSMVTAVLTGRRARYRLLETLRAYGEERLAERGLVETARQRHLEHYVGVAERADQLFKGEHGHEANELLSLEWDNLRAAVMWAISIGDLRAASGLIDAATFWAKASLRGEQGEWVRAALALAAAEDRPAPALWGAAASDATTSGDYERAVEFATIGLAQQTGDPADREMLCQSQLCVALYQLGHLEELRGARVDLQALTTRCPPGFERGVGLLVLRITAALADPGHRPEHTVAFQEGTAPLHNQWLDDWGRVIDILDLLAEGKASPALEALPDAMAETRANGNAFLEGYVQGLRLIALSRIHDATTGGAFADTLLELVDARNWQVVWWTLEALAEYWARAGRTDAAAVLVGHLEAHSRSSTLSFADRPGMLELINSHPFAGEQLEVGARMDRDELVSYALEQLHPTR